jgi:UDP-N-acetylmuramoyl-tripeptide--D-alanyl-D-alanine ligase
MATTIPDNRARFTFDTLVRATGGRLVAGSSGSDIDGVVTDSRRVRPGCLYVALRGEHHDGHAFLAQAKAAGAAAALVSTTDGLPAGLPALCVADVQHALGELGRAQRRRWGGRLIGITGSAGSASTVA